jgi:hypothetical protein
MAVETIFLVEHYWPGVTAERFHEAAARVRDEAAGMAAAGGEIRFMHSTFVPEDESAFCVFSAATSALIGQAYARADVRFERIVAAVEGLAP